MLSLLLMQIFTVIANALVFTHQTLFEIFLSWFNRPCHTVLYHSGEFTELKEMADDRANIGGTIIGPPIVGQQLAKYILTDHQNADYRPMIRLILSCQL